jgi:hypothetical protein
MEWESLETETTDEGVDLVLERTVAGDGYLYRQRAIFAGTSVSVSLAYVPPEAP